MVPITIASASATGVTLALSTAVRRSLAYPPFHLPRLVATEIDLVEGGTGRFLGIVGTFVQAAFSFQGMELVAVAAAETENPRRNIAKAVRRVFYRILIFYILGIIVTGMLVRFDDEDLLRAKSTAAASPYVIAMERAGIAV